MSDAREKIADLMTKRETEFGRPMTPIEIADGLIAALPDIIAGMVEPLVWRVDERGDWKAFCNVIGDCEAGWDDGAWAQVWGPSMWSYEPEAECRNLTADDARLAVEEFRVATILKALGMRESGDE